MVGLIEGGSNGRGARLRGLCADVSLSNNQVGLTSHERS